MSSHGHLCIQIIIDISKCFVTFKFYGWPWKIKEHLFHTTSPCSYCPEVVKLGQNSFLWKIWKNRASLPSHFNSTCSYGPEMFKLGLASNFMVTWAKHVTIWLRFENFRMITPISIYIWPSKEAYSFLEYGRGSLSFSRSFINFKFTQTKKLIICIWFEQYQ